MLEDETGWFSVTLARTKYSTSQILNCRGSTGISFSPWVAPLQKGRKRKLACHLFFLFCKFEER